MKWDFCGKVACVGSCGSFELWQKAKICPFFAQVQEKAKS
jgi:DNA-binding transcriptional regulator/RsmH inhibitor MraZ